jgi:hypothetical protein
MKFYRFIILLFVSVPVFSQTEKDTTEHHIISIEKLTYQQQPGLAMAASKIFFSKKRYSISGFGEFNYVPFQQFVNRNSGDLELYYSGLYRYSTFFGYKIKKNLIWNSEVQVEFMHDQNREYQYDFILEAFLDYQYNDLLKLRFGFLPLAIGYVNNNDEPVMFFSVNRADVERLIIPSSWNEFGLMFYGTFFKKINYSVAFVQGLNMRNYIGSTWIRQGREIRFEVPQSIAFNPQLNYIGIKNTTISLSGYFGKSGQDETIFNNSIDAHVALGSGFIKYDKDNFRFVTVGSFGRLTDTEKIFHWTQHTTNNAQALGSQVFGYLFEAGYNILPLLRGKKEIKDKKGRLYDYHEMKLALFARYERLNTHDRVHQELLEQTRIENNMSIITAGFNFNLKENIVLKSNYQYRINYSAYHLTRKNHLVETGIGFIF